MSENTTGANPFDRFVALDHACQELLAIFFPWLSTPAGGGMTPEEASPLAHAADRYLRDFLVDILERPLETSDAGTVRSYLSNWYIIHTLTPTVEEVCLIARALGALHRFGAIKGVFAAPIAREVEALTADPAGFVARLEAFWAMRPEEVEDWRAVEDYRPLIAPEVRH